MLAKSGRVLITVGLIGMVGLGLGVKTGLVGRAFKVWPVEAAAGQEGLDVNGNNKPADRGDVICFITKYLSRQGQAAKLAGQAKAYDANGDGWFNRQDVIAAIMAYLSSPQPGSGECIGLGEAQEPPPLGDDRGDQGVMVGDDDLARMPALEAKSVNQLLRAETNERIKNLLSQVADQVGQGLISPDKLSEKMKSAIKARLKVESDKGLSKADGAEVMEAGAGSAGLGGGVSLAKAGDRQLPSTQGSSVANFTGKVQASYMFKLPAVRGRLPVSVGLNYSSARIDDLRLNHISLVQLARAKGVQVKDLTEEEIKKAKPWDVYIYQNSSAPYGLGWSMSSSLGVIRVDPNFDNEYVLSLKGENIRIKYDVKTNSFSTYPKNKLKIERLTKLGAWRITDSQGTKYVFGDPAGYRHDNGQVEPSNRQWANGSVAVVEVAKQSANQYQAKSHVNFNPKDRYFFRTCDNKTITAWHLRYMEDVFGNRVKVEYEQTVRKLVDYQGRSHPYGGCGYTAAIYPTAIKYNFEPGRKKYLTKVEFVYRPTNGVGDPYAKLPAVQAENAYKAVYAAYPVVDKLLDKVVVKNDGLVVKEYRLGYKLSFKNPKVKFACRKDKPAKPREFVDYCDYRADGTNLARRWLLTSITVKGFKGKGEQRPVKYCYASMKEYEGLASGRKDKAVICDQTNTEVVKEDAGPNDVYLVKVDNGYGGVVEYEYKRKSRQLKNQKDKGLSNNYDSLFNQDEVGMVDNICSNTPWLDIYQANLEKLKQGRLDEVESVRGCTGKEGGLRRLESRKTYTSVYLVSKQRLINETNGQDKVKVTKYIYLGQPQGLAASFYPKDIYGYSKVAGFVFLGFPQVRIKSYDQKSGQVYSDQIIKTFMSLTKGPDQARSKLEASKTNKSCVMQDPRYGQVYEKLVFDGKGKQIGRSTKKLVVTDEFRQVKTDGLCYVVSAKQARLRAFVVKEESMMLGKANKKEYFYDFQVYPGDKKRNWGNLVKTINWGDPNKQGDELFAYTKYIQDRSGVYGQEKINRYLKANLVSVAEASFVSDENKAAPDKVPRAKRYNWQVSLHDQDKMLPNQLKGKALGLTTETKRIVYGLSLADKKEHQVRVSQTYYNRFGLAKRQVSADKRVGDTYYDAKYHMYPTCQVSWKLPVDDKRVVYDYQSGCRFSKPDEKLVRVYGYKEADLDRGLVSYVVDENQAKTAFFYDEYGRVVKVYGPDPNQKLKVQAKPLSLAFYYDSLKPMVTRIQTRVETPQGSQWMTEDSFYDGVGNLVEKVAYGKKDDKDNKAYISLFYQQVNANNQVTSQYKGVVVKDDKLAKLGDKPKLIDEGRLQPFLNSPQAAYTQIKTKYDFVSRPIEVVTMAKGPAKTIKQVQRFRYQGYVTDLFDTKGNQTRMISDGLGRTIKTVSYLCRPDNKGQAAANCGQGKGREVTTQTKYHPALKDKVIEVIDTDGKLISKMAYNNQGMMLKAENVDKGEVSFVYDKFLRLKQTVDAKGNRTEAFYDQLGRVVKTMVKGANGKAYFVSQTKYDDPAKKAMGKAYQSQSWVDNMPGWAGFLNGGALLSESVTDYDLGGNVVKTRSKLVDLYDGVLRSRSKDSLRYLVDVNSSSYTATGLIASSQKTASLKANSQEKVYEFGYRYDPSGRLIGLVDKQTDQDLIRKVEYDLNDRLKGVSYQNQTKVNYRYDNAGRLVNKQVGGPNQVLFDSDYVYNLNNQLVRINDKVGAGPKTKLNSLYYYDSLGRLVKAGGDEVRGEYEFDVNGNILKKDESSMISGIKSGADKIEYSKAKGCTNKDYQAKTGYDGRVNGCPYHAPKKAIINGKSYYYLYDKKGNLLKEFNQDGKVVKEYKYEVPVVDLPTTIVTYDPNNPSQVKNIVHNLYAYPNQRLLQIVKDNQGQIKSLSFYAGWYQKERYTTKTGQSQVKETSFLPTPLGRVIKQRVNSSPWQTYFVFTNHQSSTALVTNRQGRLIPEIAKLKQLKYLPYGLMANPVDLNNLPTKQTYTNQYFDEDVGLYYYKARFYNPNLGTFTSADPVQDGLNRYMYVAGNPVMMEDPSGTCPWCVGALVGGVGGAIIGGGMDAAIQYATTGSVDWGQVAVSAFQAGAEGACIGATMGVGAAGLCTGVGAAAGLMAQTAYNVNKGDKAGQAIVKAAATTSINTVVGLGMGAVGRESSRIVSNVNLPGSIGLGTYISSKTFRFLYSRAGHQELLPAINILREGKYREAIMIADNIARETDPEFNGFKFVGFENLQLGGLSNGQINENLSPGRQASLVIHEAHHILNDAKGLRDRIVGNRDVTLTKNYGLQAKYIFLDEAGAYAAEVAGGVRSLSSAVKNFRFSVSRQTGSIREGARAILFEGGFFPR